MSKPSKPSFSFDDLPGPAKVAIAKRITPHSIGFRAASKATKSLVDSQASIKYEGKPHALQRFMEFFDGPYTEQYKREGSGPDADYAKYYGNMNDYSTLKYTKFLKECLQDGMHPTKAMLAMVKTLIKDCGRYFPGDECNGDKLLSKIVKAGAFSANKSAAKDVTKILFDLSYMDDDEGKPLDDEEEPWTSEYDEYAANDDALHVRACLIDVLWKYIGEEVKKMKDWKSVTARDVYEGECTGYEILKAWSKRLGKIKLGKTSPGTRK
jgi:hypothetical protein